MLTTTSEGGLTTIVLDRPERRNALTPDGLEALGDAIEAVTDPVVHLTGAGSAFCAGADFAAIDGLETRAQAVAFAELGQSVADRIERSEAVVVAGIDGPARGGGVELALAADLRVATPAATFAQTGVDVGLFGAWGGTVRLPEVVGLGAALDLSLTGRTLGAEEARRIGLVSRVVDATRPVAAGLVDKPVRSLPVIKHRLRDRGGAPDRLEREAEAFAALVDAGPSLPP